MKDYNKIQLFLPLAAVAIILLSLYSCAKKTGMEPTSPTQPSNPDTVVIPDVVPDSLKTYLALGDSYTIGQSVPPSERFPNQTVKLLKDDTIDIIDPEIIAVTGWTTTDLINKLNTNPPQHSYSLVTLLIGVNNQYQHKSIDEYKTEFTLLLNRAIQYAGNKKSHVFVLSIPDYSVTPFAQGSNQALISKEINAFNAINKAITDQSGVHYIDITPISREAVSDPGLTAADGLHPSGKQYKRWADILAPVMKKTM